jgi:spoIIIJ-associated protein
MSEEKTVVTSLEEEGDIAADYLEGLLDIADLDGDIEISVENERCSLIFHADFNIAIEICDIK